MPFVGKRRRNIDQLLREDLLFHQKSAKTTIQQIESAVKAKRHPIFGHQRIVFEEAKELLNTSEGIDFGEGIVLEGMDAFVGTSTGVLKGITLSTASFVNLRTSMSSSANNETQSSPNSQQHPPAAYELPSQEAKIAKQSLSSIAAMDFNGIDQTEVLVGRRNGRVDMYNAITDQFNALFTLPINSEIRGIHAIKGDRILTAQRSGDLGIWTGAGESQLGEEKWTAGENLLAMRIGPGGNVCATGGKENPLKVWDLADRKCTFTAKNVRPDNLELRVPVWVTVCRFVDNTEKCIVTSTGKSQLRVYDTRAQRRPILEEFWADDQPIQALSTCCRDWSVVAGNTRGEVALFDLRAKSRLSAKFKGFAGAVRHIDASHSQPQILSCGIDRFAIVHDLNSRAVVQKIYCKVPLNCCLLCEDNSLLRRKKNSVKPSEIQKKSAK